MVCSAHREALAVDTSRARARSRALYGVGRAIDFELLETTTYSAMPTAGPIADLTAPPCFIAEFFTTAGAFRILATRDWSPHGVDRLYSLLQARYYDDTRIYRVVPGWVAQFGYSSEPSVQREQTIITDDPVLTRTSNLRGILAYSASYEASMLHATNRTTELYINYADHPQLDALGFSPVASVVLDSGFGMETVDSFYSGYGEMSDACDLHGFRPCDGPIGAGILASGNAYLDDGFPRLTRIRTARVLPSVECTPASSTSTDFSTQLPARQSTVDHPGLYVAGVALLISLSLWIVLRVLCTSRWCRDLPSTHLSRRRRELAEVQISGWDLDPDSSPKGWDLNDAAIAAEQGQEPIAPKIPVLAPVPVPAAEREVHGWCVDPQ